MPNISLTSDYIGSTGKTERPLRLMAEAGFTHVMWCHHWNDDFLYGKHELAELKRQFRDFGLTLLDVHGTAGWEKCWFSTTEYERKASVELVINRLEFMSELEADPSGDLMMHFPTYRNDQTPEVRQRSADCMNALKRTLDDLMPALEKHNRRIALENMWADNWTDFDELFAIYSPERLGICYDSGHGNSNLLKQPDLLDAHKDRLYALHLDDNNGEGDQHQPPFYGTVDWEKVENIIATSAYGSKILSFELAMRNTPFFNTELAEKNLPQTDEAVSAYLADALERCTRVHNAVKAKRG